MPGIAGKRERLTLRSLDQHVEEAADDGPDNAQRHRQDQAHALPPWDQEARNQTHDQATQDPAEKGTDAHLPHSYHKEELAGFVPRDTLPLNEFLAVPHSTKLVETPFS
jgi:hypothetical protein